MSHGCKCLRHLSLISSIIFRCGVLAALWFALPVVAEMPLTVEDFLTAKQRYRIDLDLNYLNDSESSEALAWRSNSDRYNIDVGVRYGLTLDTEISTRVGWRYWEVRSQQVHYRNRTSENGFQRLSFGINHRFSPDNNTPALLGFANLDFNGQQPFNGKAITGLIGLTGYRSIDPILMSVSASYGQGLQYSSDGMEIKPGDSFRINPAVAFAVNPWVTLFCGLQWQWRDGDKVREGLIN